MGVPGIRALKSKFLAGPHKSIMSASLAVSLLIHGLILLSLQKVIPIPWIARDMRTYQVELLRPPVVGLDMEGGAGAEVSPAEEENKESSEEAQETISLDTDDQRYVSFARAIKERIARQWKYPPEAKSNLIEGRLKVFFTLNRAGDLARIQVVEPSGSSMLDQEAIRAVRAASPYPPFPEHVKSARLNIDANFEYRLTQKK